MKVYFHNNWFSPRGTRYRKGHSYIIPDEWADQLPVSADVIEDDEPAVAIEPDLQPDPMPKKKPRTKAKAKADL